VSLTRARFSCGRHFDAASHFSTLEIWSSAAFAPMMTSTARRKKSYAIRKCVRESQVRPDQAPLVLVLPMKRLGKKQSSNDYFLRAIAVALT
jgi:hypothetical protein